VSSTSQVTALRIGVTGHNAILAEAVVARDATVTLGADPDCTLRIPAAFGISSKIVIENGAVLFGDHDVVGAYRERTAVDLRSLDPELSSPLTIRERLIVHVGGVHLLIKPVTTP
jgi:hypothetical protein